MNYNWRVPAAKRRKNVAPGRKPGVNSNPGSEPQRGERFEWIRGISRPCGAGTSTLFHPRACARVYILTPLRGWNAQIVTLLSAATPFTTAGIRRIPRCAIPVFNDFLVLNAKTIKAGVVIHL